MSKKKKDKKGYLPPSLPDINVAEENEFMQLLLSWPNAVGQQLTLTPSKAAILAKHNQNYRKAGATTARKYADDMRRGDWTPNYADHIVIYRHKERIYVHNGQHRLAAVLESGATIQIMVTVTDNDTFAGNMDQGKVRSPTDVFAGDLGINSSRAPSLGRILIVQQGGHRAETSMAKKKRAYLQYEEGIKFVMSNAPAQKGVVNAVMAAAVRAYYNVDDHDRLAEFLQQCAFATHTGPHDDGARLFRNATVGHRMSEDELSRKAEAAIYMFMNRIPTPGRLNPTAFCGELYPIPPFNDGMTNTLSPTVIANIEDSILLDSRQSKTSMIFRIQVVCRSSPRVWYDPTLLAKSLFDLYGEKHSVDSVQGALTRMRKQDLEDLQYGTIGRTYKVRYVPSVVFSSKIVAKKKNGQ